MTDEQFQTLMTKLEEINQNIALITSKEAGKDKFNLSDVCSEISSVYSAVDSVESATDSVCTAVNGVTSAVNRIELS